MPGSGIVHVEILEKVEGSDSLVRYGSRHEFGAAGVSNIGVEVGGIFPSIDNTL
jgi:hypothetical protein